MYEQILWAKEMKCGLHGKIWTELAIIRQCKKLKIPTKMDGLKPNKLTANYPNSATYVLVQTNELTLNYTKCTKSKALPYYRDRKKKKRSTFSFQLSS
jgi:hypothetical protein